MKLKEKIGQLTSLMLVLFSKTLFLGSQFISHIKFSCLSFVRKNYFEDGLDLFHLKLLQ